MSVWNAIAWGAFSSASLYIGEALARPMQRQRLLTGLVMGFGAGTLLGAVAYELLPEASLDRGVGIGVGFLLGAVTYYAGDRIVDKAGGGDRQQIGGGEQEGSGLAMFLGALLDGIPEAFVLGTSIALGGAISVAFVVAVFVSNIPQGLAGTTSMKAAGYTERHVFAMWTGLTVAAALAAAIGFAFADAVPNQGLYAEAFAAGAVLTMLASSMMPEAFKHGGTAVGLVTVVGYLVAGVLTVLQ